VTDRDHESPNPESSESAPLSRPITTAAVLERFNFNLSPEEFFNMDESRLREMGSAINTFYQTLPGRLQGLEAELANLHRLGDLTREEYQALVGVRNRYSQWTREWDMELQRAEEERQAEAEIHNRFFPGYSLDEIMNRGFGSLTPQEVEHLAGGIEALEGSVDRSQNTDQHATTRRLENVLGAWQTAQAQLGLYEVSPPLYDEASRPLNVEPPPPPHDHHGSERQPDPAPSQERSRLQWRRLLGAGRPRRQLARGELPPERPPRPLWRRLVGVFAGGERRGSGVEPPPAYASVVTTPGRQRDDVLGTGPTRPAANEQHGNGAQLDSGSGLALPPRYDQAVHASQEGSDTPQEGRRVTARTLERRASVELQQTAVRQEQHAARSAEENTYGDQETSSLERGV
jgi:hypothetical protein